MDNIEKSYSPRTEEQIATDILKEKMGNICLTSPDGRPMMLSAATPKARQPLSFDQLSHEAMLSLKYSLGLSDAKTRQAANRCMMRANLGNNIITQNFESALTGEGKALNKFFEVKELAFDATSADREPKKLVRHAVLCTKVKHLVELICQRRGMQDYHLKLGLRGGGGSFKVCLTVMEKSANLTFFYHVLKSRLKDTRLKENAHQIVLRGTIFSCYQAVAIEGSPELCRPDGSHQNYREDEAETCSLLLMHFVYLSKSHLLTPCHTFFTPSRNPATFGLDHRVLHGSAWCQMTQGVTPGGNNGPGGWDCSMKISVHFINVCPLKKPNFQPLWCATPSSWSQFEHCTIKMGIPNIEPLYPILCPSITSTCSTSKLPLKMSQCSM